MASIHQRVLKKGNEYSGSCLTVEFEVCEEVVDDGDWDYVPDALGVVVTLEEGKRQEEFLSTCMHMHARAYMRVY
jgi:hypothetical protein